MFSVGNGFYLVKLKLNHSLFAEKSGNRDANHIVINVNSLNSACEAVKDLVNNVNGIADSVVDLNRALFNAEAINFFLC